MKFKKIKDTYIIRLERDEKIIAYSQEIKKGALNSRIEVNL